MFRKHYESANDNFTPSKRLVEDTKQKMYEKMLDIEFTDTDMGTSLEEKDNLELSSKVENFHRERLSSRIRLACSIAASMAIITTAAFVSIHYYHVDKSQSKPIIVASGAPESTSSLDLTSWYGNYSGAGDSSLLTITKKDTTSFHFVLDVKKDDKTYKKEGTATVKNSSAASYSDNSGNTITFEYKHGTILVKENKKGISDAANNEVGYFVNIDGNLDLSTTDYFSKARTFASNKTYKLDINNDGTADTIKYENGILKINDYKKDFADISSEALDTKQFYMVDIDDKDSTIDILVLDMGPSNDPALTVIRYTNDNEVKVSGLSCDIKYLTFMNNGTIHGMFRLGVFQTWYAHCSWEYIGGDIEFHDQAYYTPVDQKFYSSTTDPVKLKKNLTLYESPDRKSKTVSMKPQNVTFTQTDNKHWVEVVGEKDNTSGWLYVTDFDVIPPTNELTTDVFDNLFMAD